MMRCTQSVIGALLSDEPISKPYIIRLVPELKGIYNCSKFSLRNAHLGCLEQQAQRFTTVLGCLSVHKAACGVYREYDTVRSGHDSGGEIFFILVIHRIACQ